MDLKQMIEFYKEREAVKEIYKNILEIYPHKFNVSLTLQSFLLQLSDNGYDIYKITDNWIRAIKKYGDKNV